MTEKAAEVSGGTAGIMAKLGVALLASFGMSLHAERAPEPTGWHFDAERSRIDFHLSALGVIRLDGRFERFHGQVGIDDSGSPQVHLVVIAGSLHMDNPRHRDWARSPEFFDVDRHPQVEFRSDPLPDGLLEHGGPLTGTLRVRGIDRPARFDLEPGRCSTPGDRCEIAVAGTIRRSDYGMQSRRLALSDRVHLRMRFVLQPERARQPEAGGLVRR